MKLSSSTIRETDSNTNEKYRHIYVIIEHLKDKLCQKFYKKVEFRRLMDDFNHKYDSTEKVVAVVLGAMLENYVRN